jgi:hypothetical protein
VIGDCTPAAQLTVVGYPGRRFLRTAATMSSVVTAILCEILDDESLILDPTSAEEEVEQEHVIAVLTVVPK